MARGKKYNDDIKEKAFALLACNNNAQVVADKLGLPYTTVKGWEKKWIRQAQEKEARQRALQEIPQGADNAEAEDAPTKSVTKSARFEDESLIELRKKKKEEFVEDAWGLIGKIRSLLERRLDRALDSEDILDELVEEITKLDHKQLTDSQRKALYCKMSAIKIESVKELAVVLGTLYDKQALANKEATAIVEGNIAVKKFEDF